MDPVVSGRRDSRLRADKGPQMTKGKDCIALCAYLNAWLEFIYMKCLFRGVQVQKKRPVYYYIGACLYYRILVRLWCSRRYHAGAL